MEAVNRGEVRESTGRHVWTAPCRQGFFGVSANGSGRGHVYRLEMPPVAAGPDGERGSNSNHCGALLRAMTARSVSIPVSSPFCPHTISAPPIGLTARAAGA